MNYPNYVLHVKKGYEDREQSIVKQFGELGISFEWVLDYDVYDINANREEILKRYSYNGDMKDSAVSCALKHISTWEKIAIGSQEGAFIFEDDVVIDLLNFQQLVKSALEEFNKELLNGCYNDALISLGDAGAMHVPWTKMDKGKKLYPAQLIRCSDSYFITKGAAKRMMNWIEKNGFALPSDGLIDKICNDIGILILWLEPTVVSQGSHTGVFASAIEIGERKGGIFNKVEWYSRVFRRKYLYPLFGIDLRKK
ncbi:MAG: glycosyltransferase family 25 protein [Desulfamplus sp.]|nr:glycosyltransferase family 25 protein [Desulfamplus sp.]